MAPPPPRARRGAAGCRVRLCGRDDRREFRGATVRRPSQLDGTDSIFFWQRAADSALATDIAQERLPHSRLAAVSCFDWYRVSCLRPVAACISCATSVVSSAALRLVGRHLPTLGLASSIHAVPGSLARLISREAAGGDRAHRGDGRARPHREGCAARVHHVLCRVRGAREERPLWIWFLPPCWGPLNNICVCRDKIYLRP